VDDAAETGAAGLLHLIRWMRMLLQWLLMFLLQPTSTHQDNDCVLPLCLNANWTSAVAAVEDF